ncbi:hypothetical protein VU09_29195 [Burkholderia pseudomallei]|nr:hypothetical protein VU09_29195 [Burkholderia pseudomallei]
MSLVSSICVMQSHERDDRHSRTHPVRTTAKHQNGHSNSGRGNEKAPRGEPAGLLACNLCSLAKIIYRCNKSVKWVCGTPARFSGELGNDGEREGEQ